TATRIKMQALFPREGVLGLEFVAIIQVEQLLAILAVNAQDQRLAGPGLSLPAKVGPARLGRLPNSVEGQKVTGLMCRNEIGVFELREFHNCQVAREDGPRREDRLSVGAGACKRRVAM